MLLTIRYMAVDVHHQLGNWLRAQSLQEAALERSRAASSRWVEATTLAALGEYAVEAGRIDDGVSMLEESTRIWREVGDPSATAVNVSKFAKAAAAAGQPIAAARLVACSEALHAELGATLQAWLVDLHAETLAVARTELDEDAVGSGT